MTSTSPRRPRKNAAFRKAFGESLDAHLQTRRMTARAVADATGVTGSFVAMTMSGVRPPSPEWTDLVAQTLRLNDDETRELHTSAAIDAGYKIVRKR